MSLILLRFGFAKARPLLPIMLAGALAACVSGVPKSGQITYEFEKQRQDADDLAEAKAACGKETLKSFGGALIRTQWSSPALRVSSDFMVACMATKGYKTKSRALELTYADGRVETKAY